MSDGKTCGWRCGDGTPGHKHYAVSVRENGRLLGRLTPEGGATSRNIYAAVLSNDRATSIAKAINTEGRYAAKVIPF